MRAGTGSNIGGTWNALATVHTGSAFNFDSFVDRKSQLFNPPRLYTCYMPRRMPSQEASNLEYWVKGFCVVVWEVNMYIRVTTFSYDPARAQEVVQFNDEHLIPTTRRIPGFQSYTTGFDHDKGRGVAVSTWANMDHAQAFRLALGDLIPRLEALSTRLDPPQIYEVMGQA